MKCAKAARDYVRAAGLSWVTEASIVAGITRGPAGDDLDADVSSTALPSITCHAQMATATDAGYSGNWNVQLNVHLRCNADDTTEEEFDERFAAVVDLFMDYQAALAGLSAYDDFTALYLNVNEQEANTSERSWRGRVALDVRCIGQDVS